MEILKHPDEVFGAEESMYLAGELVWKHGVNRLKELGKVDLSRKVAEAQFGRNRDGHIFVDVEGDRIILGHVSWGFKKLREEINGPK